MEAIEELLVFYINYSSGQESRNFVNSLNFFAANYNEFLQIVRWTLPCVIMSCVLLCLLFDTSKRTE